MVWGRPDRVSHPFRRLGPEGLQFQPGPSQHWNFSWAGVPYHAVRMFHVSDPGPGPRAPLVEPQTPEPLSICLAHGTNTPAGEGRRWPRFANRGPCSCWVPPPGWRQWKIIRRGLLPLQILARQAALVSTQSWKLQPPKEAEGHRGTASLDRVPLTQMLGPPWSTRSSSSGNLWATPAHEFEGPAGGSAEVYPAVVCCKRPRSFGGIPSWLAGIASRNLDRLEQLLQWMLRLAPRRTVGAEWTASRTSTSSTSTPTCEEGGGENSKAWPSPATRSIHLPPPMARFFFFSRRP